MRPPLLGELELPLHDEQACVLEVCGHSRMNRLPHQRHSPDHPRLLDTPSSLRPDVDVVEPHEVPRLQGRRSLHGFPDNPREGLPRVREQCSRKRGLDDLTHARHGIFGDEGEAGRCLPYARVGEGAALEEGGRLVAHLEEGEEGVEDFARENYRRRRPPARRPGSVYASAGDHLRQGVVQLDSAQNRERIIRKEIRARL